MGLLRQPGLPVEAQDRPTPADAADMGRHLRIAASTSAGLLVVGFIAESFLPPPSGNETVSIDFDLCLNPSLWVDDSGWTPNQLFPSGPAREITGTFDYEGDTGTLTTDKGYEIQYSRVDGFVALSCAIN